MARIDRKRLLVFGIAGILLLAGATASVAADETNGATTAATDGFNVGDHDIVIQDATIQISDVHISGPGLPEKSIDEAEYTVDDATLSTDGFVVTVNGQDIRVGHITVTLDNVGVALENVSISESDQR